jgi:hypothetical protein
VLRPAFIIGRVHDAASSFRSAEMLHPCERVCMNFSSTRLFRYSALNALLETRVTGKLAGIEIAGNKTPRHSGGNFWLF